MNNEILSELEVLKKIDMDMRQKLMSEGLLYNNYDEQMQSIHKSNAEKLNNIVKKHGWPGISLVGLEGSRVAWLIAQHSICTPDLQRSFLAKMIESNKTGDVPKKQIALLTDRILYNEGKPQKYGSIYDWDENGDLSCEIQNTNNIDVIRNEAGFPPFEEELKKQREVVKSEGGKAPNDIVAYKKQVDEWAKNTGWR